MNERLKVTLDFLAANHVMSLSLIDDGAPHSCSLMYIFDGFALSWVSDPAARHSRIIDETTSAPAAVTIAPDYDDFRHIRGLQMTGVASRLGLPANAFGTAPFTRRYSFFDGDKPAAVAAAMAKARIYRFIPSNVTFIDNSSGFASKTVFCAGELPFPG
jgi:uncharacterized protein YhbP (UPF0306 family)